MKVAKARQSLEPLSKVFVARPMLVFTDFGGSASFDALFRYLLENAKLLVMCFFRYLLEK